MFHTVICDLLGIKYPILQGAMQGGGGVELVAAVSEAGGLGVLPTFGGTDQKLRADIEGVRARTNRPFGVNIMPMGKGFTESRARACIELAVPIVTTGRADPGERVVRLLKDAGITSFTVYEAAASVAANVLAWSHIRLFTPWSMNISARMRAHLDAAGIAKPGPGDYYPTGAEFVEQPAVEHLGQRRAAVPGGPQLRFELRAQDRRQRQ